jgi:hypothetical protein
MKYPLDCSYTKYKLYNNVNSNNNNNSHNNINNNNNNNNNNKLFKMNIFSWMQNRKIILTRFLLLDTEFVDLFNNWCSYTESQYKKNIIG